MLIDGDMDVKIRCAICAESVWGRDFRAHWHGHQWWERLIYFLKM